MDNNRSIFKPVGWSRLKKKIDEQLEKSEKWITKLNAKKSTSIRNSENIPSNTRLDRSMLSVESGIVLDVSMDLTTMPIGRRTASYGRFIRKMNCCRREAAGLKKFELVLRE
jgi:hypothetical protein